MGGSVGSALVPDLGLTPEAWLFLSFWSCITLFFKFTRFISVRNLDLLLLFVLAPGMMWLVPSDHQPRWVGYVLLFSGSLLLLMRCLLDMGLSKRPLLEPNLSAAGLGCLAIGIAGLLVAETINLPIEQGTKRNPAESPERSIVAPPDSPVSRAAVESMRRIEILPATLTRSRPQDILSRVLATLCHLVLSIALIAVGTQHFGRLSTGLAVATCYLILPYTRVAVVDTGQLVAAALIVCAVWQYERPMVAGALLGLAGGWIPACLGLLPLWTGFYMRRGARRFLALAIGVPLVCGALAATVTGLSEWALALGARSLAEAGFWPFGEPSTRFLSESIWAGVDLSYRLPVLVLYFALVCITAVWPMNKNLGELISLSAALLIASQFWYVDRGGTLILLYLPLVLLMIFRPNIRLRYTYLSAPTERRAGTGMVTVS